MARSRGMTLLEILVVIGVLGILAAIVAPNMMRLVRRAKIEGAAQSIVQRLNEARAEAITRGVEVIVHPDIRGDRHYLVAWADVAGPYGVFGQESIDPDEEDWMTHDLAWGEGEITSDGLYVGSPGAPEKATDYVIFQFALPYNPGKTQSSVYFWAQSEDEPAFGSVTCGGDDCGAVEGLKLDDLDNSAVRIEENGYGDWQRAIVFEPDGSVAETGALRIGMGAFGAGNGPRNFLELAIGPKASGKVELKKYVPTADDYKGRDEGYTWQWF